MENKETKPVQESRTYTVDDIRAILGIGRTAAYQLVRKGYFKSIRIGSAIRIIKQSFEEWFEAAQLAEEFDWLEDEEEEEQTE